MTDPTGKSADPAAAVNRATRDHSRHWRDFDYVYPVLSRRAAGLSIGVNLNPDDACNFDCIYCLVDRTIAPKRRDVDLDQLRDELDQMLQQAADGRIWQDPRFTGLPASHRRVNDIAFSGNGEPTAYPHFNRAVRIAGELKGRHNLTDVKTILITNAVLFDRPKVRAAIDSLDPHHDEIWAKLDAGTESYFHLINRTKVSFDRILRNIRDLGRTRPIVIQSLFMKVHGEPVPDAEFDAYLGRLADLLTDGCQIKLVQLYTVARRTAEPYVTPLEDDALDRLAQRLRSRLPDLPAQTYPSPANE